MFTNLLEYVITDIYFQLWMACHIQDPSITAKCTDSKFHPALVEQLVHQMGDKTELPNNIRMGKNKTSYHLNNESKFHLGRKDPSQAYEQMVIEWYDVNYGVKDFHRVRGPAKIILTEVKKWHHDGLLHRRRGDAFMCQQATFMYAKKGIYTRPDGPYQISISNIKAKADHGNVYDIRFDKIVPSWSTDSGRMLSMSKSKEVIARNGLMVDLLSVGSVFKNEEDEFIFLSEIAE